MSRAGITPKQIASVISQSYPEQIWKMQDIYNIRREIKAELLQERSPIEAILYQLQTSDYEYNYQLDETGHIQLLFFAHPESLVLLKRFPEVLLMDCTYKTNRFKMPLLDILGSTGTERTYFAVFIFLSRETEEQYEAALQMLAIAMEKKLIELPKVIVTDQDLGLMNVTHTVFPRTTYLFCGWHINKNMLYHGQQLGVFLVNTDEETSFQAEWQAVVTSRSIDDYRKSWSQFQKRYRDYPKFLNYIKNTWIDPYKEQFVRYWTDQHLHFGHLETSRVEGSHSIVKWYLQVSTGDLFSVLQTLALMLGNQHNEYKAKVTATRNRTPQSFRIPLFSAVVRHITPYAL
jgi:MULE transposase domain